MKGTLLQITFDSLESEMFRLRLYDRNLTLEQIRYVTEGVQVSRTISNFRTTLTGERAKSITLRGYDVHIGHNAIVLRL